MDTTQRIPRHTFADIKRVAIDESFSSKALAILAQAADLRSAITGLAHLATSGPADWCAVFVLENEQAVRRIAARNSALIGTDEPEMLHALNLQASVGPGHVLRTGEHELLSAITEEIADSLGLPSSSLTAGGRPCSYMCLPLSARGGILGAMAFLSTDSQRLLNEADFASARDLARAAAVAIDSAKLYREAQEANRLKDEFVAMVSHELRTPLTPILGCIHLLRTAKLSDANFARALEMIERNAQAQVQIVEDLLDISRIVAGNLHLVMKPVHLVPVIETAISSVRSLAEAKGIQIIIDFEDVQQPIDGDSDRLQQIVWNLLTNAIKFTPPQGRIEISVREDNNHICIQVTDTGIGIPSDTLPYIFDRFRQLNEGTSKTRTGLGLGLAIVRHLVELHQGSVHVASAGVGKGAVFTLKLPVQVRKVSAKLGA